MSKAGGARPGAGRPVGSANKKTQEIVAKALQDGVTPLDVMLGNMRFAWDGCEDLLMRLNEKLQSKDSGAAETYDVFKEFMRMRQMAEECAKDAAPYVHPRLQAVEHSGKDGGDINIVAKIERVVVRPNAKD